MIRRLAERLPLAVAPSSNRTPIDLLLRLANLEDAFVATVSSEEVGRGKPAPDVYLRAAEKLGYPATSCGAVKDSSNGIRVAHAAGSYVVAFAAPAVPAGTGRARAANVTLGGIGQISAAMFSLG